MNYSRNVTQKKNSDNSITNCDDSKPLGEMGI